MEIKRLVTGAQTGNPGDFDALVEIFYKKVHGTIRGMVKNDDLAQDLVQETFIRAWTSLKSLREASAFPSWLWSIASNVARASLRMKQAENAECCPDPDMDQHADEQSCRGLLISPSDQVVEWTYLLRSLRPQERMLAELRYIADLSLREIGAVLDLPETRVKSRLFELRKKLRAQFNDVDWDFRAAHHTRTPDYPFLQEKIMDKLQVLRLGSHVFERLSLATQVEFAMAVLASKKLPETCLGAIGMVDKGPEFIALYGSSLTLKELIGILNHVDRFTEIRLINHLDLVAPQEAEKIKQNMFVFEDLVMLDPSAIRALFYETNREVMAVAIKGTDNTTRNHVLSCLPDDQRLKFEQELARADGGHDLVRSSQEFVITIIKGLEESGRLILLRKGEGLGDGEGQIIGFTVKT